MYKFLMVITGVVVYELFKIDYQNNKKELFVLILLTIIALLLLYTFIYNPINMSISEFFLRLIKAEYIK